MSIPTSRVLRVALSRDLRKPGSKGLVKVLDDSVRKVFTTNRDGAVFVFSHKQRDPAFWVGMKHYGSGPSSRIRVRRTQSASNSHDLEESVSDEEKLII
jgi:hypothetical protein